ncbi:hypothetical protein CEXT_507021 [Caerostris extrusa]|uniref:Uncharacterized protein n=1 Tax=Caerostris extrusa TaxID=172846 RepID=A0AAV4XDH2_CAEEX|nr:hypothetical protein CEXT_507021 [Caerostris extrusa]
MIENDLRELPMREEWPSRVENDRRMTFKSCQCGKNDLQELAKETSRVIVTTFFEKGTFAYSRTSVGSRHTRKAYNS